MKTLCVFALALSSALFAQQPRRMAPLKEQLGLTDAQVQQIQEYRKQHRESVRASRIHLREEISGVLTPEQKEKLKTLREDRGPRRAGPGRWRRPL